MSDTQKGKKNPQCFYMSQRTVIPGLLERHFSLTKNSKAETIEE